MPYHDDTPRHSQVHHEAHPHQGDKPSGLLGRLDPQPQIRRFAIGAPDAKLLDLEPPPELDHLIKDLLHDMRINEMALGLDNFLKLHEV